jgi:hypothetical protein
MMPRYDGNTRRPTRNARRRNAALRRQRDDRRPGKERKTRAKGAE